MRVSYYQRKSESRADSIARVFDSVRRALPPSVQYSVVAERFASKGLLRRLYGAIAAVSKQSDVNHITGHIHYIALFLHKRRTVPDCP